jgi:acetylornithine deacetylase/succinyl-diaminopimelate desuccinylase-like protein
VAEGAAGSGLRALLERRLEEERDAMVALCRELVAIPSPNPPGDTTAIAEHITRFLRDAGLPVRRYARESHKPNLVSTVGRLDGPRVVLCGHMDTFPRPEAWDAASAYGTRVENGRLYGTGVGDMRAGLAATLTLGRILAEADADGAVSGLGGVVLVFTSDEESGGRDGAELVLREAEEVKGADACIIGDQSGVTEIGAAEKGFCWLRVATTAQQGHSAYRAGAGAIADLIRALDAVAQVAEIGGARERLPEGIAESPAAARASVNIGTIAGGLAPNLAAQSASAAVDIRFPVGVTVGEVLQRVERELARAGLTAAVEPIRTSEAFVTSPGEPVVASCVAHAARVTGRAARPVVRVGASDGRLFRQYGIPTVVCGPVPHNFAAVDEFIELEELFEVAAVHAGVMADLLDAGGSPPSG